MERVWDAVRVLGSRCGCWDPIALTASAGMKTPSLSMWMAPGVWPSKAIETTAAGSSDPADPAGGAPAATAGVTAPLATAWVSLEATALPTDLASGDENGGQREVARGSEGGSVGMVQPTGFWAERRARVGIGGGWVGMVNACGFWGRERGWVGMVNACGPSARFQQTHSATSCSKSEDLDPFHTTTSPGVCKT